MVEKEGANVPLVVYFTWEFSEQKDFLALGNKNSLNLRHMNNCGGA